MTNRPGRLRGLGVATWWQQMRSDMRPNAVIAAIVFATALVVSLAPSLVEHAARLDLSEAVTSATPEQRNFSFESRREIGAGAPRDPFSNIEQFGKKLSEDNIPPAVSAVLSREQWVFDTPEFVVSSFPDQVKGPFDRWIRLRYQRDIEEHSRLVEGSLPSAQDPILRLEGPDCPENADALPDLESFEPLEDQRCVLVELPLFEVAFTQQTADDMLLEVGDRVTLLPSTTDLSFRNVQVDTHALWFVLRVSGIIELDDESLEYWYADSSLHRPPISENPDFRFIFAVGLMSPDQYRPFRNAARGVELDFAWRFLVDPDLIDEADGVELAANLEKIGPPDVDVITLLPELLNEHLAQRRLTVQLLSMAAVAFAAGAFAAIWTVALVDAARRRRVTSLIVDRGASRVQIGLNAVWTGVLVTLPAALLGALTAGALIRHTSIAQSVLLVVGIALGAILVIVVAGLPTRAGRDAQRSRIRRVVGELLLIGLAIGSILLLRRRATDVASSALDGFDATLAAAPVLNAVAIGVIALRLIGPLARVMAIVASRVRSASWLIGVRRLIDQPPALRAPSLAIAIVAAVAVFAAVIFTSVTSAQDFASWQQVAGEHRIETANLTMPLPEALQNAVSSTDDRPAFGTMLPFQRFRTETDGFVADVVALDLEAFRAVVDESAVSESVASALDGVVDVSISASEPLPAVLVGARTAHRERLGTSASLQIAGTRVEMEFRSAIDQLAGIQPGRPTVLIDRTLLRDATGDRTVAPSFVLLGEPGEVDEQVRTLLGEQGVLSHMTSREELLDTIAGDPLSTWTRRSLWSLALASLVFAVVTSAAAAIITSSMRQRDLGVLAILGHERRSLGRVVAIELLPGIGIAGVLGAAAGATTARLLSSNLSLGAFAGNVVSPGVVLDWRPIAVVGFALALTVMLTVAITVRSLRRLDHAMLLRRGDS